MITTWIDRLINLCKWPMVLLGILNSPFLFAQLYEQFLLTCSPKFYPFWMGVGSYIVVWHVWFKKMGSFLPTLEHELVHVLFAWLTLHQVTGFQVRWRGGGHVKYIGGEGNWLITISPYFFPLFLLIAFPVLAYTALEDSIRYFVLGCVLAFDLISTWREIDVRQPDLKEVGYPFATLFLPPALSFLYGCILHFLLEGNVLSFGIALSKNNREQLEWLFAQVAALF